MNIRKVVLAALLVIPLSAPAQSISWPQQLEADDGSVVVIYQPQVEEFSDNNMEARAAVSVKRPSLGETPVFGAIWIKANIDTDRDARSATIRDVEVGDVRFADASEQQEEALADFIEQQIEGASFAISVDELIADLDADSAGPDGVTLKHQPPIIMLSTKPAMLISIDGDPVLQEMEGSEYEQVVNSAFLIVKDGRNHYLYIGSNTWYMSREITGNWSPTQQVPKDIMSLVEPADDDASEVAEVHIIVATEPTELLVSDGAPSWAPVEGMDLLYMDNTDSNAFLELSTQQYYVLLSGRWYRGEGLLGELNWTHVPNDQLPAPFGDIPEDSVNGAVLSQVAGTSQARAAILDNTIPQTAAIDRDDASFSPEYDGTPSFAPIEEIDVLYAQNTSAAVFRYVNLFYACDDGVWYIANSATGPWSVATEIPDAIYKIPASNPHHNVTYVKVYDVTPEVVYVGYTPGYYGSYYYHGSVVYGTGWRYNPWYGPYYYPRYPTWGFHVTYNPWYGWGVGVSWTNGPFRFTYSRHGSWWGVGGYRPYPRPVVYGGYRKTNININVDNSINIGGGNIGGGRNRPETRPNIYNRPENSTRNVERPAVASSRQSQPTNNIQNNVLTDRSGNVYQRNTNGDWNQRNNGQWTSPQNLDRSPTSRPATQPSTGGFNNPQTRPATRPQLERDYSSRQRGAQRTQNYQRQAAPQQRRSPQRRR